MGIRQCSRGRDRAVASLLSEYGPEMTPDPLPTPFCVGRLFACCLPPRGRFKPSGGGSNLIRGVHMLWYYPCPICSSLRIVDWDERADTRICHIHGFDYVPPSPGQSFSSFVDTQNWPVDMEVVVHAVKGRMCTVPGCNRKAETLDHRIPYAKNGRTSVHNLFPMCNAHNKSKGDTDYDIWLLIQSILGPDRDKRK
jgi:5-methylcytosine-specific restriction endonuclease McrA